jgi:predicted nicotinamide N-methyase
MHSPSQLDEALKRTLPMARIEVVRVHDHPPLALALINADFPDERLSPDVMRAVIERPAYWAFCWGSGLGLARLLFAHPEWVRGKTAIDLGSGSGVAGIAAALCGASQVIACDIDPDARAATARNAQLNGVPIEVVASLEARHADVLLMADVLYDAANLPLLEQAARHARVVLVADSRVKTLPDSAYRLVAEIDAATFPNLGEFDEFLRVRVFRYDASP